VSPEAGALRALFVAHLEAAHVPVLHFSNWGWDKGPASAPVAAAETQQGPAGVPLTPFAQALRTRLPVFVMVSDCLVMSPLPPGLAQAAAIGELTAGLLVCCLRHGVSCCYMSGLQIDAITAVGFMASAERSTLLVRCACCLLLGPAQPACYSRHGPSCDGQMPSPLAHCGPCGPLDCRVLGRALCWVPDSSCMLSPRRFEGGWSPVVPALVP
jgi:hypothetical protein